MEEGLDHMNERRGIRRVARRAAGFLSEALRRCALHSIDTQSAALAFYTLFSLTPVLLVFAAFAGRLLVRGQVQGEIARQLKGFMGPDAGRAVVALLEKAGASGIGAGSVGIAGIVAFVLGATAVFIQLQEALNRVWEVAPHPGTMFRSLLRKRLLSFVLVLAVGFVLLASFTASTALLALTNRFAVTSPLPVALIALGNEALSFFVLTVLVALVYRVLPDAKLEWRDVGLGALLTSVLFSIGKWAIGLYLARTAVASQFGVAGALIVILVWVYSQAAILLVGAEVTAVGSRRYRQRAGIPEAGATGADGRAPAAGAR